MHLHLHTYIFMLSGQETSGEVLLDSLKVAENIRSTVNKEEKADGLCCASLPNPTAADAGIQLHILYIYHEAMGLVRRLLWFYLHCLARDLFVCKSYNQT